jgi:hypothetical protein
MWSLTREEVNSVCVSLEKFVSFHYCLSSLSFLFVINRAHLFFGLCTLLVKRVLLLKCSLDNFSMLLKASGYSKALVFALKAVKREEWTALGKEGTKEETMKSVLPKQDSQEYIRGEEGKTEILTIDKILTRVGFQCLWFFSLLFLDRETFALFSWPLLVLKNEQFNVLWTVFLRTGYLSHSKWQSNCSEACNFIHDTEQPYALKSRHERDKNVR